MLKVPLFICLFVLVFSSLAIAQEKEENIKDKQRRREQLIEQILADVQNLKLPENRALVYPKIGGIVWKNDEKLARSLFQNSINELINAQLLAEADKKNITYQHELITGQTTRPQILQIIAANDAELALDYLYKSRPAALSKIIAASTVKTTKISNSNNQSYLANNETNLEQRLMRLAADQKPERALKFLKESLKKGLSDETLSLLKKLHEKDAETGKEVASEVVAKLIGANFNPQNPSNYQNINISTNILNEFIRQKSAAENALKFDESQMRSLAEKLVSFFLQQNNGRVYFNAHAIIPIAEKLTPSSVEALKKLQRNSRSGFDMGYEYDPEISKILNSETTAEQLLNEAKKFPLNSRRQFYQTAANKFAQQGNINRATEILRENYDDDAFDDALNGLKWQYSYNLISEGKFEEAERLIDEFPETTRVGALINLANSIYQKNQKENKSYAVAVLNKARSFVSDKPEDSTEMQNLMQIISAYCTIESSEAFRLFEPLISQINELSDAAAVINGFQRNSNVKQNEFLLTNGNPSGYFGADFSILSRLSKEDYDRTINIIDSFTRREIRVSLKLQLLENALN
jgi:hypothetical protein